MSPSKVSHLRFDVFTAMTMKNSSSYLTGDILRLLYRVQRVNAMYDLRFFTAVTMKNVVFWDIKTQFVPHRRHMTSPLQSPAG
jgi:hypothetical protein